MTSKAFPPNVEPRGKEIFGPPPPKPQPVKENIFNTDKFGTRKPVEK